MRWARYAVDGRTSFGLVDADRVEDVRGSPFASYKRIGVSRPLSEVALRYDRQRPGLRLQAGAIMSEQRMTGWNKQKPAFTFTKGREFGSGLRGALLYADLGLAEATGGIHHAL